MTSEPRWRARARETGSSVAVDGLSRLPGIVVEVSADVLAARRRDDTQRAPGVGMPATSITFGHSTSVARIAARLEASDVHRNPDDTLLVELGTRCLSMSRSPPSTSTPQPRCPTHPVPPTPTLRSGDNRDTEADLDRDQAVALAVARLIAEDRTGGEVEIMAVPERADRTNPAVELITADAVGTLAIEHTLIEPYPGQIQGENWLLPRGDEERAERLPDKCTIRMKAGDLLRMLTPGGGGWGDPAWPNSGSEGGPERE